MIDPATGRPVLTTLAGTSCQDQNLREITDWSKCLHASRSLGLPWGNGFVTHNSKDGEVGDNEARPEYDFARCVFSKNGRNSNPSDFAAICDTIPGNEFQY